MLWSLSPNLPISLRPLKLTAARAFPKRIHPYSSDGIGSLCVEQLQRDYEARVRFLAVRFLVAPPLAALSPPKNSSAHRISRLEDAS